MKNYEVQIKEAKGSCESELFEEMAKRGDLTSIKIAEVMGMEVTIRGYAVCDIKAKDKEFTIFYIDTDEYGLVSAGSEIFAESVKAYFGRVSNFKLLKVKTKRGSTYKAVPVLAAKTIEDTQKIEEDTSDDLPF